MIFWEGNGFVMYAISYLELNTCCLIIMMLILHRQLQGLDRRQISKIFTELLIAAMVYVLLDMACGLQQNEVFHLSPAVSAVLNVGFYISSYALTYLSFAFAEYEIGRLWVKDSNKRMLSLIPAGILTIMTVCTLKWHFFFYIDEAGLYQKGPYYVVIIPFVYIYILIIAFRIVTMFPQKKYYAFRGKLEMVTGIVVFPLISGIIQAFYTGISIISFGLTLGIIQVFTAFLTDRITMDELTQVNNRTKLVQYLENYIESHGTQEETKLRFLMIDLDDFKGINDTYGHIEGDNALVRTAKVLKKTMAGRPGILARYGGDEFCIAGEMTEEQVEELIRAIYANLDVANNLAACPYNIGMSIGCAQLRKEIKTIPDLVRCADEDLYQRKREKKGKF